MLQRLALSGARARLSMGLAPSCTPKCTRTVGLYGLCAGPSRPGIPAFVRLKSTDPAAKQKLDFEKTDRAEKFTQVNLRAKLSDRSSNKREFTRLFQLIKQERWHLSLAVAFLLVSSGVTLALPAAIGKILDSINKDGDFSHILGLEVPQFLTAMTALFVVGALATFGRIYTLRSIGERLVAKLRSRTFRKIMVRDAEFFDANRTGDLISRLGTDANVVSRSVTQNVADGLRASLTASLGLVMMSYISLKLTAVIAVCLPPMMIGSAWYGRRVRSISREFQVSLGNLSRVTEERLNNVRTAHAFGAETQEISLYNRFIRNVYGIAMQEAKATGLFYGGMQLMGNTVVIILLAIGANMVSQGTLTFGELSSFIMYTAYAGSAIGNLGNFYSELMKGAGAASRLFEIEDTVPAIPPYKGTKLKNPYGDIVFDHVQFAYPTRPAVNIFHDLTFTIKAGSNVCIVGQSGGGKSTIMALLLRFYDPAKGSISIGGQVLKDTSAWSIRRNISIVSQEPALFNGTVAENILYGRPDATRNQVLDAARQANCTFLADFPDGIDTQVGPRGTQLSGGQKQRIAIARAIITKPAVLILDEATSALDGESEMLVNEALSNLIDASTTTISIAHRLSTIAQSREVVVLGSNGTAVEHGKFLDLYNDSNSALSQLLLKRHELVPPPQSREPQQETAAGAEEEEYMDDEPQRQTGM